MKIPVKFFIALVPECDTSKLIPTEDLLFLCLVNIFFYLPFDNSICSSGMIDAHINLVYLKGDQKGRSQQYVTDVIKFTAVEIGNLIK